MEWQRKKKLYGHDLKTKGDTTRDWSIEIIREIKCGLFEKQSIYIERTKEKNMSHGSVADSEG